MERAEWSRERANLTLQIHDAEKELVRVKEDLRRVEIQLEREREKYLVPSGNTAPSDKEKVRVFLCTVLGLFGRDVPKEKAEGSKNVFLSFVF